MCTCACIYACVNRLIYVYEDLYLHRSKYIYNIMF